MKLLRVIRADDIREEDETFDGRPITISSITEHEEHVAQGTHRTLREDEEGTMREHIDPIGSSPQVMVLSIDGEDVELSPSDLIVVMR